MRLRLTEQAPMLPVTAAMAAGIVIASWRMPPVWVASAGVAVCVAAAALCLRTGRQSAAAAIVLAAMFLGAALTAMQLRSDSLSDDYAVYEIEITDDAYRRADTRTLQTDARAVAVRSDDGRWRRLRGRLRIYADTSLMLAAGQRILCRGGVRPFAGGDGYAAMMRRKGYGGRLYLTPDNILQVSSEQSSGMFRQLHRRAVAKIAALPLRPENMAVAQAVGTGESSMLGRGVRAEYSRAGTAHLLALSGLHVGIVYLLINLLLRWLPLLTHGHIIRSGAAVIMLWLYVLSTGMPPSAIRAALMFSMLQVARASSADYSAMNALAAAAFVSLCFDTGLLFDAGFRLSYIAVAAIILCALPLSRRLHIHCDRERGRFAKRAAALCNFITDTIVTGFVVTAATAPLVSHLFGVIPLAGILIGPAAIAAAAATVMLTALWITLPLGFAAPLFGRATDFTAGTLNSISGWIAGHDHAALAVRLSAAQTAACYLIAAAAVCIVLSLKNNSHVKTMPPK